MSDAGRGADAEASVTGFAGLVSLVSDVAAEVEACESAPTAQPATPPTPEAPAPVGPIKVKQEGRTPDWLRATLVLGAIAGAIVIVAVWLSSSSERPAVSQTTVGTPTPSNAPPSRLDAPSLPVVTPKQELMPPVGTGIALSISQLRWCRYQKARLEAAREATTDDDSIDRFNAIIADYNSRCASFKYRRNELNTVDAEVRASSEVLKAEGIALVAPRTPMGTLNGPDLRGPDGPGPKAKATKGVNAEALAAPYRAHIQSVSEKYRIPEELLIAVILEESGFNPSALSKDGKKGLMQLTPEIAKEMYVADIWNPFDNIDGGARYLRALANEFDGDLTRTLAAYHAGVEPVKRAGGVPKDKATRTYVSKVLDTYDRLRRKS